MKLEKNCALLVIGIQQEDFMEMNENNMNDPRWAVIRNGSGSWMYSGQRSCPSFRSRSAAVLTWWTSAGSWTAPRASTAWKTARKTTTPS